MYLYSIHTWEEKANVLSVNSESVKLHSVSAEANHHLQPLVRHWREAVLINALLCTVSF